MTITKYNSNNGLTLEFKWALEELINIARLTKDLWSKFYLGTNIRPLRKAHPESAPKYAVDARSTANSLDVVQKSTIRALFKAKSVHPKTYSPPLFQASNIITPNFLLLAEKIWRATIKQE